MRGRETMSRTVTYVVALLFTASAAFAADDDKAYVVKLHRPDQKGAKFDVTIAGAVRQQTRMRQGENASEPADHLYGVELKGVVEINEVDEKGNAMRATYTVERCVKVVENNDEVIVAKGGVVVAEAGEKDTTFTLKDGELTEEQKNALDVVASLPRKNAPTADDLFGTKEKQGVGSSWPVNVETLAADAKSFGMAFDTSKTKGTVRLVGVEQRDGVEFLKLTAETNVGGYTMEIPKEWSLPPGMAFKSGTIEMSFDGLLPVDPEATHAIVSNTYARTMIFEGKVGRRGQVGTMEMKTTQMVQLHAVPTKE
jgi:hypothetical protein